MYDVTKKETFKNLNQWINEAKSYSNDNTLLFLIGNKADCEKE